MEYILLRKIIFPISILLVIGIASIFLIFSPKQPPNTNENGKIPSIVIGGKLIKDAVQKVCKFSFKEISAKRHIIQSIGKKSVPHSPVNTVVDSKIVNIAKDVKDINAGMATQNGNLFRLSNGNVYQAKSITEGANLIPLEGKGFYQLTRGQYNILRELKINGGLTDNFYKWYNPQLTTKQPLTKADLDKVFQIYKTVFNQ